MIRERISSDYTLDIPSPYRGLFPAGLEVAVTADEQGRLIITAVEDYRALLLETFGMWADRTDLTDSADFVNDLRRDQRLERVGLPLDEVY